MKIKELDKLGKVLSAPTSVRVIFDIINRYINGGKVYLTCSIEYCEDEIKTTFDISEDNEMSNIKTVYTGNTDIDYLALVEFDKYKYLTSVLQRQMEQAGVTYKTFDSLLDSYTY